MKTSIKAFNRRLHDIAASMYKDLVSDLQTLGYSVEDLQHKPVRPDYDPVTDTYPIIPSGFTMFQLRSFEHMFVRVRSHNHTLHVSIDPVKRRFRCVFYEASFISVYRHGRPPHFSCPTKRRTFIADDLPSLMKRVDRAVAKSVKAMAAHERALLVAVA